jgi:hypothetical protein
MPSPLRARKPSPVVFGAVVVGTVLGAVLTVQATAGHGHTVTAIKPPAAAPAKAVSQPVAQPAAAPLTLPSATAYVGAVPTGFPQTLPGAIAAAYGYSRLGTSLDVATALRTVESIAVRAAGWFTPALHDQASAGIIAQRQRLGLPEIGPAGQASITLTPSGYQLREGTRTNVTVLTLNVVTTVANDGTQNSGLLVYRWALRWDGARWRATTVYLQDGDQTLAVTPLTAEARAKGWQVTDGG